MSNLFLVRHAETEFNVKKNIQGCSDSPLTEYGKMQAANLAGHFSIQKIDFIFSSPLGRAIETTKIICSKSGIDNYIIEQNLKEINLSPWEGKSSSELLLDKSKSGYYTYKTNPSCFAPIEGESLFDLIERIFPTIQDIVKSYPNNNIIIVTHDVCIRAFLVKFFNKHINSIWEYSLPTCSVSTFSLDNNKITKCLGIGKPY